MGATNRVIIYSSSLLPWSETFIKAQAQALTRWQPVLVGERRVIDGLSLSDLSVRFLFASTFGSLHRVLFRFCAAFSLAYPPVVSILRRLDARLVHVHFGPAAVDIWPCVRKLGLPLVVTLHGYDINTGREYWRNGNAGSYRRRYPEQLQALAREPAVFFVAVSEAIRQQAIRQGIAAEKIAVSYIGIDTQQFVPSGVPVAKRSRRILFVGRLVEKKGVQFLVRAFADIRKKIPDAELVVAGDGPLREETEQLARDLAVPVYFPGVLDAVQVQEEMSRARVFCLPSVVAANGDAEGFGLVLLEAQACGVPVVSSARGGAGEGLLDGDTGYRVGEGDTMALAERLARILSDDELAARMSARAVTFVRNRFDLRTCTSNLETIYDECTSLPVAGEVP